MGPWFTASSSDTKYTTELGRRQELCKQFTEELKRYPHFLQNFNYDITDWLPFYWAGYNQTTRYTYLLKKYPGSSSGMGEYEPQYPAKYYESAE